MRLLIATPAIDSKAFTGYYGSLLNTLRACQELKLEVELFYMDGCSSIGHARNVCAAYALRGEFDKLLFIDADQTWQPEDVLRLLRSERTLIGGTYMKKQHPYRLNFNPLPEHRAAFADRKISQPSVFFEYKKRFADEAGEVRVTHIPTGFMLIDRSVLEALKPGCPEYLFGEEEYGEEQARAWDLFPSGVLNGRYETEDWFFCSIATEAGHPPYLNTEVIVGHIGNFNYRLEKDLKL